MNLNTFKANIDNRLLKLDSSLRISQPIVEAVNFVFFANSFLARPYANNKTLREISLLRGFPGVIAGHELISLMEYQKDTIYLGQFVFAICNHLISRPYYQESDRKLFVKYCFILLNHFVERLISEDDLFALRSNKSRFLKGYGKFTNSIRLSNYKYDIANVIANELGFKSEDSIQSIARIMSSNRPLRCKLYPSWSFEQSVKFINENKDILIAFENENVPYLANYELTWQKYDQLYFAGNYDLDFIKSEQLINQIYLSKSDVSLIETISTKGDCEILLIKTWCVLNYLNESKPWDFLLNLAKFKNLDQIAGYETHPYIKVVTTLCFLDNIVNDISSWSDNISLKVNALLWSLINMKDKSNLPEIDFFIDLIKNRSIDPKSHSNPLAVYLEPLFSDEYNLINKFFTSILLAETSIIPTKYYKEGIWQMFCKDLNVTDFYDEILFIRFENKYF